MAAEGLTGELRYGYFVVARLGPWTLENERCETVAHDLNTVQLTCADPTRLELWLHVGRRRWQWKAIELLDLGTPFVIRVHGRPTMH